MPQQIHGRVSQPGSDAAQRTVDDDAVDQAVTDAQQRDRSETAGHSDEFLDEVDAVLEENILEVLKTYVQRGGQ